ISDASVAVDASLPPLLPDSDELFEGEAGVPDSGVPPLTDAAVDMAPDDEFELSFTFSEDAAGWEAGFSEFFPEMEAGMNLVGCFQSVGTPPEGVGPAFALGGTNHSDDVFMFMKAWLGPDDGVVASRVYQLQFEIVFYSDAPSGCVGIGGPPGESVYL